MNARRALTAFAILVSAATSGCGPMRHASAPGQEDVVIHVQNQGFPDVIMYVVPTGDPWRIGSVTGNSKATFKLPARMLGVGQLQLLARPLAGKAFMLPAVSVSPGDQVEVTIGNVPAQSIVTVAPR